MPTKKPVSSAPSTTPATPAGCCGVPVREIANCCAADTPIVHVTAGYCCAAPGSPGASRSRC